MTSLYVICHPADAYRDPQWGGGGGDRGSEDAAVLPLWEHGERSEPRRRQRSARQDPGHRVHLQVSAHSVSLFLLLFLSVSKEKGLADRSTNVVWWVEANVWPAGDV